MEEQAAMSIPRRPLERLAERLIPKDPGPVQPASTQSFTARQPSNNDIDGLIKFVNLQSVIFDAFPFLVPLDLYPTEKPFLSRLPFGTSLPRTNIVTEGHAIKVFDVSGHESFFTLEKSGFQFTKSPIRMQQWTDSSVCSEYIPKLEEWLIQHLNCPNVFIYAYNFRGNSHDDTENKSTKTPFLRAHCDATATSCFKRLQLFFPDKAHAMMKERVRFLNVWRSISTPIQDCPLALCDFRTIRPEEDLVPADIIFPHYQDEAYEVLYNPDHRWFYKKGMEWDDVLLFKLGDNSLNEAPLCPHSAFMDPSVPKGTPSRVSIEVRAIIIG
ncbi:hypothetical protein BJ875DRAFT_401632 [Amylocarpus encephaloides]|uniref:Uncharacterized protein n=1 Tax=Amylocarpus encephaloides TaxID=45428 RepID=A0A9P7YHX6_9HELO|nr:hypothetical protein BJ875DRAFT_401632 [Amylocarpus encephaloides]